MKLEQSTAREVTSGIFPVRVPVTALAQLSALQLSLSGVTARPPWAMAKAKMKDQSFIFAVGESDCVRNNEVMAPFKFIAEGAMLDEDRKAKGQPGKVEILYTFAIHKAGIVGSPYRN
jgi:hypothetical protein